MHRNYSFIGGLAFGLVLFAAAVSAAEYSEAFLPGLPPVDAYGKPPAPGNVKTAENDAARARDDAPKDDARKRLKTEVDRVKRATKQGDAEAKPASPQPAKKKEPEASNPPRPQPQKPPVPAIDPDIDRAVGKLIIMRFSGSDPSDNGPKAIRALLHDRQIAGVMFSGDNIQSKGQLKELVKSLAPGGDWKPLFAISEIGGAGGSFPSVKDFESWPSEREVASKGDPDYAYLTYRSLGESLSGLGFTVNFGPTLGTEATQRNPSASFSDSPLQAGVFAKTFILGQRDGDIAPVPLVDGSEAAVRALKTLLVSYPAMPIAIAVTGQAALPFTPYDGLVRGARICLVTLSPGASAADAASPFGRGCDAVVIDGGKESPAAVRELAVRGVSDAIKSGSLTLAALNASAQRLSTLRSASQPPPAAFTTRTAQ